MANGASGANARRLVEEERRKEVANATNPNRLPAERNVTYLDQIRRLKSATLKVAVRMENICCR